MWYVFEVETWDAYMNMALDSALVIYARKNPGFKAIRFFRFEGPGAITLERYQDYREVSPECEKLGVCYVRRPTGGRGLYHHPTDLAYSVVAPRSEFKDHLASIYTINRWVVNALKELDIEAKHNKSQSILVNGRKIAASAQNNTKNPLLQHGSVFYEPTWRRASLILPPIEYNKFTSIKEQNPDVSLDDVSSAFFESFKKDKSENSVHSTIPEEIKSIAVRLVEKRYGTEKWNNKEGVSRGNCAGIWGTYRERPEPEKII